MRIVHDRSPIWWVDTMPTPASHRVVTAAVPLAETTAAESTTPPSPNASNATLRTIPRLAPEHPPAQLDVRARRPAAAQAGAKPRRLASPGAW